MSAATSYALAAYFLAHIGVAIWARAKRRGTIESYYLADRDIGMFALTATLVASAVNALAVTGTPALFYTGGVLFSQMFVAVLMTSALVWSFGPTIAKQGRQGGIVTQAEYFGSHYGSRNVQLLAALLGLLSLLPFLAAQIVGVGKILAGVSGGQIPFETGVISCALAIAIYVFFGGARAVVASDVLQGIIILIFLLASAFVLISAQGGVFEVLTQISLSMPDKLVFSASNLPPFIDNCLSWSFAFFLWPHMFQRLLMARKETRIQYVATMSCLSYFVVVLCILATAMAATVHFGDVQIDPDRLVPAALSALWPVGGTILIVAILALAMSTIDSIVLTSGSILSRDFLSQTTQSGDEVHNTTISRVLVLLIMALAISIAVTEFGTRTVLPLVTLSASIATLALWPLLGTVWPKVSTTGVILTQVSGLLAMIYVFATGNSPFQPLGSASTAFIVSAAVFLATTLVFPRKGYT
ncbi:MULTISPECIES: sodium:solute symporter [unclassified Ruegeria]|uniref:sodium:solute symporter family protein n=1 Tax=unclassified Ruegeria TaxID=2625375 RepID=UPI0012A9FC34|nr:MULTISPECIES: sodium:solute symporter family protein [unclassified Ruegeria]QFT75635.1 Sodium/pantothenate symporter [Ruegeria sp. THAF33]UAB91025.1 sodium:solute symporter family protein [Ruegeria sp. SCSIO 43209]